VKFSSNVEPLLRRGDLVGVMTPGFGVRARSLRAGIGRLEALGFRVVLGPHALDRDGYLAGPDDARASDLNALIADRDIRAIWFARGGYGSARLLDRIRWSRLGRSPKTLIGYSDVTALFAAATARTRCSCLYGPVVTELADEAAYHLPTLKRTLGGHSVTLRFARRQILRPGRAAGRMLGGNLSVLVHLLGTRHAPRLRGAVLFVEDVGEPTYRLDRMLSHLRMSSALDGVAGVVVGSFRPVSRRSFLTDRPVTDLLRETFEPLGVPVVLGLPAGHLPGKRTLPLGGRARLDTAEGRLTIEPRSTGPSRRR
jgi:muramoyltetrapeptide carboxypeptidase